jgi:alpha-1,2-mannosyltransferase
VVAYSRMAIIGYVLGVLVVLATSSNWLDSQGRTVAGDFSVFWAAGSLAIDGQAAAAYDLAAVESRRAEMLGHTPVLALPWGYPPTFFLVVSLLALLPYGWALLSWTALTSAGYLVCIRRILPSPVTALAAVAWPAFFVNFIRGQNGCLSAALLGAGLLLLETQPVSAGILFGALCFKPQVAILLPLALLAGRQWRALSAMTVTVALAAIATVILWGRDVWPAFETSIVALRATLETRKETVIDMYYGMVTVFSASRLLGAAADWAFGLQSLVSILVSALVIGSWRLPRPTHLKGAVLAAAIPLATPYALVYDLLTVAVSIAFLVREGLRGGFLPWERSVIAAVWLVPAISPALAFASGFQVAPLVELALLAACLRRLWQSAPDLKSTDFGDASSPVFSRKPLKAEA